MENLTKIRDMCGKYGVSARTLRYYEDMGLLTSIRTDEYAYRLYDDAAVKKLEQILILRKLNISIKDIQMIFNASGTAQVLQVLGKKVTDIDSEVALLHELKGFILEFIRQIKAADFSKGDDVKMLYEKAKEIENQLTQPNPIDANRVQEVMERTDKQVFHVQVVKLPTFSAVSSGGCTYGHKFWEWSEGHKDLFKNIVWDNYEFYLPDDITACALQDGVTPTDVAPYEIITVEGGLYAGIVCIDMDDEGFNSLERKFTHWLEGTNFIKDEKRVQISHMLFPHDDIKNGLGYHQVQVYIPIAFNEKGWTTVYSLATDAYIQDINRGETWQGFSRKQIGPTGSPNYTFCEVAGRNGIEVTNRANDWDGVNLYLSDMGLTPNHYCTIEVRGRITGTLKKFPKGCVALTALPGYELMGEHYLTDGETFTLTYVFPVMKDKLIRDARISSHRLGRKMPFIIEDIEVTVKPFTANPNYIADTQLLWDVTDLEAFAFAYDGTSHTRIKGQTPRAQANIEIPTGKYLRIYLPTPCDNVDAFLAEVQDKLPMMLEGGFGHTLTNEIEVIHENKLLLSIEQRKEQDE
ncbi:MAG: MerR family transcriptional regulator [Defluviitaleaceae bacterium]|nr:MerR family transcriptional regulator [Defluviitaleaceae bacterium]MCL2274136.1 MerR family transcriptional regulator [Defluviitaleaceae bacterium]